MIQMPSTAGTLATERELLTVQLVTLTGLELLERVATEPDNADLFGDGQNQSQRLEYCSREKLENPARSDWHYIVAYLGGRIVGFASLAPPIMWIESSLRVVGVSVEEQFRNHGIAAQIIDGIMAFADEHHYKTVCVRGYSSMGRDHLSRVVARLSSRHPGRIDDRDAL